MQNSQKSDQSSHQSSQVPQILLDQPELDKNQKQSGINYTLKPQGIQEKKYFQFYAFINDKNGDILPENKQSLETLYKEYSGISTVRKQQLLQKIESVENFDFPRKENNYNKFRSENIQQLSQQFSQSKELKNLISSQEEEINETFNSFVSQSYKQNLKESFKKINQEKKEARQL